MTAPRTHLLRERIRRGHQAPLDAAGAGQRGARPRRRRSPPPFPAGQQPRRSAAHRRAADLARRRRSARKRQVFFVSLGGFDNHDAILTDPSDPDDAARGGDERVLRCHGRAGRGRQGHHLHRLGFRPHADLERRRLGSRLGLDASRDGRRGQRPRFYGTPPAIANNGPDDVGQGRLLPTTSVDQFGATLASWFGVASGRCPTVLPNINNYNPSTWNLGFV